MHITRHIISYLCATTVVDAQSVEDAARIAEKMSLEWIDSDQIDEGAVDYEVSSDQGGYHSWREDGPE